jgi:4-hydroxy-4-methyl-2-oxoglutarate aldolase
VELGHRSDAKEHRRTPKGAEGDEMKCSKNRRVFAAATTFALLAAVAVGARQSASTVVQVNRAARDTWTPVMDVLKASRNATVTDAQLQRLRELPLEAIWGALQRRNFIRTFEGGFQHTVPNAKVVGRAVTMRYLPVRPDVMEAVRTLAKEGDWDYQYNVRAGEDLKKGDVVVVELGGMVDRATFLGDVTALGMQTAGAQGVIVDGGLRDLAELVLMKDLPMFYRGAHASAMADQVGVQWNGPIRLGGITVLPGDIVVADVEGVQIIPPQLVADVIKDAEDTVYTENFKREMMRSGKYRARDIYPTLSPELEKLFEEWKKTHKKEGIKANVGEKGKE